GGECDELEEDVEQEADGPDEVRLRFGLAEQLPAVAEGDRRSRELAHDGERHDDGDDEEHDDRGTTVSPAGAYRVGDVAVHPRKPSAARAAAAGHSTNPSPAATNPSIRAPGRAGGAALRETGASSGGRRDPSETPRRRGRATAMSRRKEHRMNTQSILRTALLIIVLPAAPACSSSDDSAV